jgi:hypothetical protein
MTVKRGTSGINLTTLTGVTLKGMPASATVNLNTLMSATDDTAVLSAFTISGETDITAYIQSKTATQAVVEAIVAPHTIATGKTIELAFSGDPTRTYTFEQEFTLDPGKVYDFVFMLKAGGDGMTNCYMVKPGDPVTFPVSRAYTYNATTKTFNNTLHVDDTQTYTGEFDAAVVWADELVIKGTPTVTGSGNTAEVRVETNATPANGGNAVVAIKKKGTQEIVWSYHIWVSKYKPDDPNAEDKAVYENQGNTNDNGRSYVFMDRNLGATFAGLGSGLGTGLFYQWGRKDPFPATDGTLPEGSFSRVATSNSLGTINNTIENPNVFLYNASTSPYDWHWASRNDELWNTSNNEKTIYDPCPSGWRVPRYKGTAVTGSPWYGFTTTSKTFSSGWEVDTNAIYPAAGLRLSESVVFLGRIVNEGSVCYHWSATPGNESAMCTHFDSVRFHFDAHLPRSRGCCVRCVRE